MKLDSETMQQQIPHPYEYTVKLNTKKKINSNKISNISPKQTLFKSKNDQHVCVKMIKIISLQKRNTSEKMKHHAF